ncbi:MAG: branched-chain amino acid transaminase, partial [Planctomycetes bacterium]|nr:branched-chain amino acid transaminase [Planctomycetota bacterium]
MVEKAKWIWMDGSYVGWDEAQVHVLTHTLHYGLGAFEGIRAYEQDGGGTAIFRHADHVRRLFESCHIVRIDPPHTPEVVQTATKDLLVRNGLDEAYIRPLVYVGHGAMGLHATSNPVHVAIAAFPWGAYLGEEGLRNGIRARVSSFARSHPNTVMVKGKICGHYVNNILAKREAVQCGYDEAILLDTQGYVAEASGENIFCVRDGAIATPPIPTVLAGITRASAIAIARDQGIPVVERMMTRDELYIANEVFITG